MYYNNDLSMAQENTSQKSAVVSGDGKQPASRRSKIILLCGLALVIILGVVAAGYLLSKNNKKSAQPVVVGKTQDQVISEYQASAEYKKLSPDQQLDARLTKVNQYASVNAYQNMLDELSSIQKDIPNAEKNVSFLVQEFIANYQLQKQEPAIDYAHKIKALGQPLPKEYAQWKGLIDQYANK